MTYYGHLQVFNSLSNCLCSAVMLPSKRVYRLWSAEQHCSSSPFLRHRLSYPCTCPAQVDVLPLERFNAVWRPDEPERLQPVFVERVTIREALAGPTLGSLLGSVQLVEPTFQVWGNPKTLKQTLKIHRQGSVATSAPPASRSSNSSASSRCLWSA